MQYLQGTPRWHMQIICLESSIVADSPVWVIDAFVEHLDLSKSGFEVQTLKSILFRYLKFRRKTPNILTQALQALMNNPTYTGKLVFCQ